MFSFEEAIKINILSAQQCQLIKKLLKRNYFKQSHKVFYCSQLKKTSVRNQTIICPRINSV